MKWLALLGLVIVVGGAATAAALTWGQSAHAGNPFAIRRGMTVEEVRRIAGDPDRTSVEHLGEYARIRARDLTHGQTVRSEECWFYKVTEGDTAVDGAGACFFRGRVLNTLTYNHG